MVLRWCRMPIVARADLHYGVRMPVVVVVLEHTLRMYEAVLQRGCHLLEPMAMFVDNRDKYCDFATMVGYRTRERHGGSWGV